MNNRDKELNRARFIQQIANNRAASLAAEQQARPVVTDEQREMRAEDRFKAAFQPKGHTYRESASGPRMSPWEAMLAGAADDDVPSPPTAEPAPAAPQPAPPQETRARQIELAGSAEDLFQRLEQRLQTTAEAVELPPDARLRRALRELPGSAREALAKRIEEQDYGLEGYFDSRGFNHDYRAVLVGSALARRFQDAQRLDPSLTPEAMLQAMTGQES